MRSSKQQRSHKFLRLIICLAVIAVAVPCLMVFFCINNFKTAAFYKIIAPSPDGRSVITSDNGTTTYLWDMETGREILTFKKQTVWGVIEAVDFSPDGRYAATAGDLGIILWDVAPWPRFYPKAAFKIMKKRFASGYLGELWK